MDVVAVRQLFDEHRYSEAYALTKEAWRDRTHLDGLDGQGWVLASRLAARLGARKWSRAILREAGRRFPHDVWVRASRGARVGDRQHFDEALSVVAREPELDVADAQLRSSWCTWAAGIWSVCRDVERAHDAAARAVAHHADASALAMQASVYLLEDRCAEAWAIGERAWAQEPGSAPAAHVVADALSRLGRAEEAAERLATTAETTQTAQIAAMAASRLIGCAEALDVDAPARAALVARAAQFVDRYASLVPLADREERAALARTRCDLADVSADHEALRRWGPLSGIHYYRRVADNLSRNPSGVRVLLPHTPVRQNHETCAPASFVTCMSHFGLTFDHEQVASELTHGGTATWRWRAYCAAHGLVVRGFIADGSSASALVRAGLPFLLMLRGDDTGHAVAVVGLDEAQGALLLSDPSHSRLGRWLVNDLPGGEGPLGPRAMVVVPAARAAELNALELTGCVEETARSEYVEPRPGQGHIERAAIVDQLVARSPHHPITLQLTAWLAGERSAHDQAVALHRALVAAHPTCREAQAGLIGAIASSGNTPLLTATLRTVVEEGRIEAREGSWASMHPGPRYLAQYGELLSRSPETQPRAERALRRSLAASPGHASTLHALGNLRWSQGRSEDAELLYRAAASAKTEDEELARAYADVCRHAGRTAAALAWLRARAERHDRARLASAPWVTLAQALSDYGHPDEAERVLNDALERRPDDAQLLGAVAGLRIETGRFDDARALLVRLERHDTRLAQIMTQGALSVATGAPEAQLEWARRWAAEQPGWASHCALVEALAAVRGADAALAEAQALAAAHPEHDGYAAMLCERLALSGHSRERAERLRTRVALYPDDASASLMLVTDELLAIERRAKHERVEALECLAPLWRTLERSNAGSAKLSFVEAHRARVGGDVEAEVAALERCTARAPERVPPLVLLLTRAQQDQRFADRALTAVERALARTAASKAQAPQLVAPLAALEGVVATQARISAWRSRWPDDAALLCAHAELALLDGRGVGPATAVADELPAMIAQFPHHRELRLLLAQAHVRTGQLERARAVLEDLVRQGSPDPRPRRLLAQTQLRLGHADAALATLEGAVARAPSDTESVLMLASSLMDLGRSTEAEEVLASASARVPDAMDLHTLRIACCTRRGDGERAVARARSLVERYPEVAHAHTLFAQTSLQHREHASRRDIEEALTRAIALDASSRFAVEAYAMYLAELGDTDAALALIARALPSVRHPEVLRERRAWLLLEIGDEAAAIAELVELLRAAPHYARGWDLLLQLPQTGEVGPPADELLAIIGRVHLLSPEEELTGVLLMERAAAPDATIEAAWERLIAEHPDHDDIARLRVTRLHRRGMTSHARALLERQLQSHPDDVHARMLSLLFHAAGQDGDAAIRDAVSVWTAPDPAGATDLIAWDLLQKQSLLEDAIVRLLKALPQAGPPHLGLIERLCKHLVERGSPLIHTLMAWAESSPHRDPLMATIWACYLEFGISGPVLRWFARHRDRCRASLPLWSLVGQYHLAAGELYETTEWLADWRARGQVGYLVVQTYLTALEKLGRASELVVEAKYALETLLPDPARPLVAELLLRVAAEIGDDEAFTTAWPHVSSLRDLPHREVFACFALVTAAKTDVELAELRTRLIATIAASAQPERLRWARPALHRRRQRLRGFWRRVLGALEGD